MRLGAYKILGDDINNLIKEIKGPINPGASTAAVEHSVDTEVPDALILGDMMKLGVTFLIVLIFVFYAVPLYAAVKDGCGKEGIIVKNLTTLDLWYRKNGGACEIWIHNHIFRIRPKDTIKTFSDLACKKSYCKHSPTYKIYKSLDMNGDCRVRILPHCNLSDM